MFLHLQSTNFQLHFLPRVQENQHRCKYIDLSKNVNTSISKAGNSQDQEKLCSPRWKCSPMYSLVFPSHVRTLVTRNQVFVMPQVLRITRMNVHSNVKSHRWIMLLYFQLFISRQPIVFTVFINQFFDESLLPYSWNRSGFLLCFMCFIKYYF
jgi:hypothetical protein